MKLEKSIGKKLTENGLTLSVAESMTGGMLSNALTNVPGSSRWFKGGVTAYTNEAKKTLLGVKEKTLKKYGAVSIEAACEMAACIREKLKSNLGVAITGIAGPTGGTEKTPVGTVFMAITDGKKTDVKKLGIKGRRITVKKKTVTTLLVALKRFL